MHVASRECIPEMLCAHGNRRPQFELNVLSVRIAVDDRRWGEHNPKIQQPEQLLEPIKWMLGSTTGAKLMPFKLADVPAAERSTAQIALEFLLAQGVVKQMLE